MLLGKKRTSGSKNWVDFCLIFFYEYLLPYLVGFHGINVAFQLQILASTECVIKLMYKFNTDISLS